MVTDNTGGLPSNYSPVFIFAKRIVTVLIRKHLCSNIPSGIPGISMLTNLRSLQGEGLDQQHQGHMGTCWKLYSWAPLPAY